MRLVLQCASLLWAAAAAADAESLTSAGSGTWSGVGGGTAVWSGGTPSADDDFTVAAGHTVRIESAVSLTTGSVTVAPGGTLVVAAAATLRPGRWLTVRAGAAYRQVGTPLQSCRIGAEPDWSTADPTFWVACAGQARPGQSLVFLDEDPPSGRWTGRTLWIGAGSGSGALRPALNRYAWYEITAVAGAAVSVRLDPGGYASQPGAPYRGTRGNPTPSAIAAAQLTFVPQPGRRATRVDVAPGYGSIAAMHGDLGSHYLYFTEAPELGGNPTRCSGLAAKILHSVDGGTSGDRLYVAGDVSGCTHPDVEARIIPGARRGDLVALVSPAVIDGAGVGSVRFESGAHIEVRWARFVGLGATAADDISPRLRRNCNVCFFQSAAAPGAPLAGAFEDIEVVLPVAGGGVTQDTAVVHFDSLGNADYRYPDVGLLDLSGLTVARLHVHDSYNEAITGGSHGIYVDGAKALRIDGARIERMSDDLFGSNLAGNETGTARDANGFHVRRLLLYEAIAEHDNSQQCFEPAVLFGDGATATGVHNYQRQAGAIRATDVIAVGCHQHPVHVVGLGARLNRIVSGGQFDASRNPPFEFYLLPDSGVAPQAVPNIARNAVLTTYAEDGTRSIDAPVVIARIQDSVVFGDEQSGGDDNVTQGFQACVRTFWHHAGSAATVFEGNTLSNNVWGPLREWQDCAVVSTSAEGLARGFTNYAQPHVLRFVRLLYLQTRRWSPTRGPIAGATEPFATLDLRGAFLSTEEVGTAAFAANPGGTVEDVCYESLNSAAADFGPYASGTTSSLPALAPDASDWPTVGSLVGDPASDDPCERAKPWALGLADVGTAHVLLGDFAMLQLHPVYTSRVGLLLVARESAPVACGLGAELAAPVALWWMWAVRRGGQRRRRSQASAGSNSASSGPMPQPGTPPGAGVSP